MELRQGPLCLPQPLWASSMTKGSSSAPGQTSGSLMTERGERPSRRQASGNGLAGPGVRPGALSTLILSVLPCPLSCTQVGVPLFTYPATPLAWPLA